MLMLGNEAIVRGALEAGVSFVAGYPGTPSSEVTDGFAAIAERERIAFEYSVNEKVALEVAFAASLAGARSLCAMKHLGLMVAGDPLSTIPYVGVEAGMVIVSAGDPSCHTSPNETDQRHLGPMLHLPVVDPSTPAEALEMTRAAFDLSEATRLPVLLRTTTRVAHSRGTVVPGAVRERRAPGFVRNPSRYVPVPANARRMRVELKDRIAEAERWAARAPFFRAEGSADDVVIAAGAPAATTADLLRAIGATVPLWRIGAVHPLPERALVDRLRRVRRVLVVEELSPFLEDRIAAIAHRHGLALEVLGKRSGHFPEEFEYEPHVVERALHDALHVGAPPRPRPEPPAMSARAPSLCPGCPHRAAFTAARSAFDEDQLFFNDIGCYTLGCEPPLRTADALLCMGAGFTLATGVARVTGKRTVGAMGDSTFFHAGMPALLDAVKENANVVLVVLDNRVTAMTGFQQSPARGCSIEDVARALGATHVEVVDPYDQAASIDVLRRARAAVVPSVVVVRRACPVHQARTDTRPRPEPLAADASACRTCGRESARLRCDVPLAEGYERNLARVASLRSESEPLPDVAPCATRCPLSLCIQGYAGHIAAGEYAHAVAHVMARTALPESVCRVCHEPCEAACVRAPRGESIAINDLKRFVVDWAERTRPALLAPARGASCGLRAAVVGAGPAGLAASIDLVARGWDVVLYDAADRPGGLLAHAIPEHRLPAAALAKDLARAVDVVAFRGGARLGSDVTIAGLLAEHDAVLLAIGAHSPRRLDLPGARPKAVVAALDYLRACRHGTGAPGSENVAVIGGGNAAIDAARTALRRGARRVTLVCLESRDDMPALAREVGAAESEGIVLRTGTRPESWDARGVNVRDGEERSDLVACDLAIVAIGQSLDEASLGRDVALALTDGLLRVDAESQATSHARVFAAGDATPGQRTVTSAMASGLRAAWGMDAALRGRAVADRRPPPTRVAERTSRTPPRASRETGAALSEADARAEAMRCLMCGKCANCRACIDVLGCPAVAMDASRSRVVVDPAWCIGCGVCADVCSNRALAPARREAVS